MHRATLLSVAVSVGLLTAFAAHAQETKAPAMTPDMQAQMEAYQKAGTPGMEHGKLAAMTGNYDLTVKSWYAPGAPPSSDKGTATRRMILGNRVLVEEVTASMMGQPFTGQGLHGFDNVTGRYWATWNDSMSTGVMVSDGTCDAQLACTYTGKHHDPVTKKEQTSRMTSRWTDTNTEVFEMYGPGPDGKETKMMEITYRKRP